MFRIAFNPDLPVVASSSFSAKGHRFATGAPIDWRALGITAQTLLDWWRAGQVAHPTKPAPVAGVSKIAIAPAESVHVAPPRPRSKRRR
jgi:hypothetical protein